MEKKLVVKICTGTLCYIMGGAELQGIDEHLSEEIQDMVDIKGCLDHCSHSDGPKAPFVEVDGKGISEATVPKVVQAIKEALNIDQ